MDHSPIEPDLQALKTLASQLSQRMETFSKAETAGLAEALAPLIGKINLTNSLTPENIQDLARFPGENPNPVVRIARNGVILYANSVCLPLLAYWNCQVGKMIPNEYQPFFQSVLENGESQDRVIEYAGRIYSFHFTPILEAGYVNGYGEDITERKKREEELQKLNRTYQALSKSNQAMLRAKDETGLMREICRIVTEDCGYTMVWIGFAEQDADKSVQPVAYAGFEDDYLETLHITWADTERGRGPTGTAIRTGKPTSCRHMLTDPAFKPWREEAIKRGYSSSLVLPLLEEGRAFGAITVYSKDPDPFSEDDEKLLTQLAKDLVYGLTTFRLREAQAKAEQARRASEERYYKLFTEMTEGFAIHEIVCDKRGAPCDYRFLDLNPAFERLTGLKREEVKGKLISQVEGLRDEAAKWVEIYGKVALTGDPVRFENYSLALDRHYEIFAFSPAPLQFAVIFMNISERKQVEEALRISEATLRQAQDMAVKNLTQIEVQRRLIEQREQERLQIARDLHDGPVQALTGASFGLQALAVGCEDPQAANQIDFIRTSILEAIYELRSFAQELRPPALFTFGLGRTVQSYIETFKIKHPGLHTDLKIDWVGAVLPEQTSIALFRIFQESLNNIVKHAQATEIRIHLTKDETQVSLAIEDNGAGFKITQDLLHLARQGHLGLVGINERAEAIGGQVEITSQPGQGTRLLVKAPVPG